MFDDPRPFRPRERAPASPGSAGTDPTRGVHAQIRRVRRRANAFALQNALYLSAALVLLAVPALVTLAFFLTRAEFAVAVWAVLAVVAVLTVRSWRSARRRWIGRTQAAVVIDRRAALEERLATLAAREESPSRLRDVLVRQNVSLLSRWTPASLVPRVVPRTIWLLVFAAAASFLALRWSDAGLAVRGAQPHEPFAGAEGAEVSPRKTGAATGGEMAIEDASVLEALLTSLPDRLRAAILGTGAAPGRGGQMLAQLPPGAAIPPGEMRPGDGRLPGDVDPSMVPPVSGDGEEKTRHAGSAKTAGRTGEGEARSDAASKTPVLGDRPKELPRVESGQPRPGGEGGKARAGQGGGRAAGSGSGGDGEGLYGRPEAGGRAAARFDLDLTGRATEGPKAKEGEEEPDGRFAARLASEQRLDDAIRRAQVPPEYEGIVRRLFSRADENQSGAEQDLGAR